MGTTDGLLTSDEVAEILQIEPITLRKWRHKGRGPNYIKDRTLVRYRRSDVDAWIESRTVTAGVAK